jgi:hypothetical protein
MVVVFVRVEHSQEISKMEMFTLDDDNITLSHDTSHQSSSDAALYSRAMETSASPV